MQLWKHVGVEIHPARIVRVIGGLLAAAGRWVACAAAIFRIYEIVKNIRKQFIEHWSRTGPQGRHISYKELPTNRYK